MNNASKGVRFYFLIMAAVLLFVFIFRNGFDTKETYTYREFETAVEEGIVERVDIHPNDKVPTGQIWIYFSESPEVRKMNVADVKEVQEMLLEKDVPNYMYDIERESVFMTTVLPMLLMAAVFMFLLIFMNRQANGGNNKMMNFGKSRATLILPDTKKISFKNVAGLEEEKEELEEIVDFLREPKKYLQVGARIPKGLLLVGPPGTGKTLLAKAVAGEAGVPFFSISGSDFVEMFVGVGASRVRDLFAEAKKNAPCIVFIDEIDAVARRRGSGMGGGHDEREQTLNQMLVEMDGFGVNEGIIVMAATNRVDILDPAILRPGRFDRKAYIVQKDIRQAFVKVGIGAEKKSKVISDREKRITAYHEAGHAILFHVLPDVGPVHTISIIPTGMGAAGYTMPLPAKDEMFLTKGKMLQDIIVGFGGRVAEELVIGDVTTGASQDIRQSTEIARAMVTRYGMSEKVGTVDYGSDDEVFIGRDLGHARKYGENMQTLIDEEVKRIVDECYAKAKTLIEEHMGVLHRCAELLVKEEKIGREAFEELFQETE